MTKLDIDDPAIGRFDRSFLIHMIKDFFLVLLFVTILEFAFKAALVYYDFAVNGTKRTETAASEISENVVSIMMNEGGPVAARTLYPILEKNWQDLGYTISIIPSPVTVTSIEELFDFSPKGIPEQAQADRIQNEARLDIIAEESCLSCHSQASVGDVLGSVSVKRFLTSDFSLWWKGVQLGSGLAIAKIILHSVLLYILLRGRLQPLLLLRSVVSNLARAFGGLDQRAEIRSSDEFGALAKDLNLFLDRVSHLVGELDKVLRRVVDVNDDILTIQFDLRGQMNTIISGTRELERKAMMSAKREPLLSNEWFETARKSVSDLEKAMGKVEKNSETKHILDSLHAVVSNAEGQIKSSETLFSDLVDLGEKTEGFQMAMAEMVRLEERMKGIIESGTVLVGRLNPHDEDEEDTSPMPA